MYASHDDLLAARERVALLSKQLHRLKRALAVREQSRSSASKSAGSVLCRDEPRGSGMTGSVVRVRPGQVFSHPTTESFTVERPVLWFD